MVLPMTTKNRKGPLPIPRTRSVLNLPSRLMPLLEDMRSVTGQSRSSFIATLLMEEGHRRGLDVPALTAETDDEDADEVQAA